jgi:hypothetical protein
MVMRMADDMTQGQSKTTAQIGINIKDAIFFYIFLLETWKFGIM